MPVVGGGFVGVEVKEPALVVPREYRHDVHVIQLVDRGDVSIGQKDANVRVAGLDRRHLCLVVRNNDDIDLIDLGATAPVAVVRLEDQVAGCLPLLEDKGTVADRHIAVPVGIVQRSFSFKDRSQNMLRQHKAKDRRRPGSKGLGELEHQRVLVFGGDALQVVRVGPSALHGVPRIHDHLISEHKVIGRHRLTVRPGGLLVQRDLDGQAVL